jgi:hypothetical protein
MRISHRIPALRYMVFALFPTHFLSRTCVAGCQVWRYQEFYMADLSAKSSIRISSLSSWESSLLYMDLSESQYAVMHSPPFAS